MTIDLNDLLIVEVRLAMLSKEGRGRSKEQESESMYFYQFFIN